MLLLLEKLGFAHNHNHNHNRHHHMSESDLAYLQVFRANVSDNLYQVLESLNLGSDNLLSLTWIHQCFRMLQVFNNAFAKLMVEIDYPVSSWEACSVNEYLDYTINLLDLLNSISSSLSHLNQARVLLSHALSLMESSPSLAIERMREVKGACDSIKEFNVSGGGDGERIPNGKERIFHEAMLILESSGYWVCGVVLSGLKSDVKPIMEIMRSRVVSDSTLMALDFVIKRKFMDEGGFVKEVTGVNETVRLIVSRGDGDSDVVKELKRRVEVLGNGLKGLKEEEEELFGKVMAARNEVLQTLRMNN